MVSGTAAALGYPLGVTIAKPPPQDRSISDVWSALGGELKPSLDLVVTVAIDAVGLSQVAALVLEEPRISFRGRGQTGDESEADPEVARETVGPGTSGSPGRVVRMRSSPEP